MTKPNATPRKPRRRIEFHILINYPFSNLNRDEFGSPKVCNFAGTTRGRISSQSLKRSWREFFKNYFDREDISTRTRALPLMVKEYLLDEGRDEEFADAAVDAIKSLFVSDKKSKKEEDEDEDEKKAAENITSQIVPLTPAEIYFFKEESGAASIKDLKSKNFREKLEQKLLDLGTTLDIALWGRMVTSSVVKSSEAAMQVAHGISTHEILIEQDFFAAVDDVIKNGAAMLDNAEYDSACYYEYGCLDFDHLVENFGGDEERAREALSMLLKTVAYSNPSGKNTTTGSNILPAVMLVESKEIPYNLVNAFAEPCTEKGKGLIYNSAKALAEHCDEMNRKYGIEAKRAWFSLPVVHCESAETAETFSELIEKAAAFV